MNDELKAAAEICPGVTVARLREALAAYGDGWETNEDEGVVVATVRVYLARVDADEAERERLAVPRGRLMAWIHNYGDQKQPEFIADLKAVLGMEDDA